MSIRRVFGARLVGQADVIMAQAEEVLSLLGPAGVLALAGILASKGLYDLASRIRAGGGPATPGEAREIIDNANAVQHQSRTMWDVSYNPVLPYSDPLTGLPFNPADIKRLIEWGSTDLDWVGSKYIVDAETGERIPDIEPETKPKSKSKAKSRAKPTNKGVYKSPMYKYDPNKDPFRKKPDMKWEEFVEQLRALARKLLALKPLKFSADEYVIERLIAVMTTIVKTYPLLIRNPDAIRQMVNSLKLIMNDVESMIGAVKDDRAFLLLSEIFDYLKSAISLVEDKIGRF